MNKKISLKHLYEAASRMKWYQFQQWVAKELFDRPGTEDTSALTDGLYLSALGIPKTTAKQAYELGFDAGWNGTNSINSHFSIFSSPTNTAEWERGRLSAVKQKETTPF